MSAEQKVEHILTIDIGGSAIKYGVCDLQANLTHKGQEPTPYGPDVTVNDLVATIKKIFDTCNAQVKIDGVSIAAPGVVDKGFMRTGGFLFYNVNQPLAELIEQAIGMRPTIENDAKAAAEAELWIGALKGVSSGAVLILGTGLGGGLVLNGKVYQGAHGAAGELSAYEMLGIKQKQERGLDYCPVSVSTTGLLYRVCNALGLEMILDEVNHNWHIPIDGRKVFELLEQGEPKVQEALDEFGLDTGYLIYNLCVMLDLEKVAIGGGISCQPALIDAIKRGVFAIWDRTPLTHTQKDLISMPEIVVCQFQNDANLIGAMHHFLVEHGLA